MKKTKIRKKDVSFLHKIPPVLYGTLALFFLGTTLGFLATHLLRDSLYAPLLSLYQTLKAQLDTVDADRYTIFLLSFRGQLKLFLLLWFFSLTNVWRYYLWGFSVYTGFCKGLLLSFCLLISGAGGILDFLCFQFPQCLLMVPGYGMTIYHCHRLNHQLNCNYIPLSHQESTHSTGKASHQEFPVGKKQLILHQLPCFLLDGTLLALGSLLEGYCNLSLLHLLLK